MKARSIFFSILYLFVIQIFTQWVGVALAQGCLNNSPASVWGTNPNVGIHTTNPQKPLHIFSSNVCTEAAIRLEYQGPYWGHLALINPLILNNYSFIGIASDMILQADTNAGNVLLTTRNKGKAIKFSTTPNINGPQQDRERFRISDDGYNTFVDIKATQFDSIISNPILRFQRINPDGSLIPTPGNNWKIGLDAMEGNSLKIGAMDSVCGLFDNTKSLVITKEGNLGIGIGNPISQFQITKGFSSMFMNIGTPNSDPILAATKPDIENPGLYCRWNITSNCVGMKFKFLRNGGNYDDFLLSDEYTKVIFTAEGNIGLGTLEPNATLEIKANNHANASYSLRITDEQSNKLFQVRNDGLLLIGNTLFHPTTNPDELDNPLKLSVDGAIAAKEVLVSIDANKWSDFVFADDYKLMPLDDLDKSIKENRKLPGIPSSEEVAEKGIKIAENQAKLLQKIEELTLYVIDLQKQCTDLKKQLSEKNNGEE